MQEATLVGLSMLPSIAYRVNEHLSLGLAVNAMYGVMKEQVAINNIVGADGQLKIDSRQHVGLGRQPRRTLRVHPANAVLLHLQLAGGAGLLRACANSPASPAA